MNKPAAFIVVENGQIWLRTSAETEEAIRTGFIIETVPLYTALPKREPLSIQEIYDLDKYSQQPFEIYTVRECISWIRKVEKAHGIGGEE